MRRHGELDVVDQPRVAEFHRQGNQHRTGQSLDWLQCRRIHHTDIVDLSRGRWANVLAERSPYGVRAALSLLNGLLRSLQCSGEYDRLAALLRIQVLVSRAERQA